MKWQGSSTPFVWASNREACCNADFVRHPGIWTYTVFGARLKSERIRQELDINLRQQEPLPGIIHSPLVSKALGIVSVLASPTLPKTSLLTVYSQTRHIKAISQISYAGARLHAFAPTPHRSRSLQRPEFRRMAPCSPRTPRWKPWKLVQPSPRSVLAFKATSECNPLRRSSKVQEPQALHCWRPGPQG